MVVPSAKGRGKVWGSGLGSPGSGSGETRSPQASAVAGLRARPAGSRGCTRSERGG